MPAARLQPVITLRGTAAYGRFLDKLLRAVQASGHTTKSRTALIDLAVAELAFRHGIVAPARAKAWGTNRHGEPAAD